MLQRNEGLVQNINGLLRLRRDGRRTTGVTWSSVFQICFARISHIMSFYWLDRKIWFRHYQASGPPRRRFPDDDLLQDVTMKTPKEIGSLPLLRNVAVPV